MSFYGKHKKDSVKKRAQLSEQEAALVYGGKTQINSGALRHSKGDVKCDDFLIDDKFTDAASYSLKLETMDKLRREALQHRRTPLLRVSIRGTTYCIVEESTFLNMRGRLNES